MMLCASQVAMVTVSWVLLLTILTMMFVSTYGGGSPRNFAMNL